LCEEHHENLVGIGRILEMYLGGIKQEGQSIPERFLEDLHRSFQLGEENKAVLHRHPLMGIPLVEPYLKRPFLP
jgi:hypothetical protein